MAKRSDFYLGLFVLSGVVLLFVTLLAFGMSELFARKVYLVTWFSESVQGLAEGSQVKYKGVPIGNVKKITIQLSDKLIRVDMDIELKAFNFGRNSNDSTAEFYDFIARESLNGLRCRLEYSGLTGMKYVEIDYFDLRDRGKKLPEPGGPVGNAYFIPSEPSTFTDMLDMLTTSLAGISKIDFAGISADLRDSVQSMDRLLKDARVDQTLSHLAAVSENLETSTSVLAETLTEEEIRGILDNLRAAASGVRELVNQVEQELKEAKIPETTASFRDAMGAVSASRDDLESTAHKLNRTLETLDALINMIDQDPSALLRGKKRVPVDLKSLSQP